MNKLRKIYRVFFCVVVISFGISLLILNNSEPNFLTTTENKNVKENRNQPLLRPYIPRTNFKPKIYEIILAAFEEIFELEKLSRQKTKENIKNDDLKNHNEIWKRSKVDEYANKLNSILCYVIFCEAKTSDRIDLEGNLIIKTQNFLNEISNVLKRLFIICENKTDKRVNCFLPVVVKTLNDVQKNFKKIVSEEFIDLLKIKEDSFLFPEKIFVFLEKAANVFSDDLIENDKIKHFKVELKRQKYKLTHIFVYKNDCVALISDSKLVKNCEYGANLTDFKGWNVSFVIFKEIRV